MAGRAHAVKKRPAARASSASAAAIGPAEGRSADKRRRKLVGGDHASSKKLQPGTGGASGVKGQVGQPEARFSAGDNPGSGNDVSKGASRLKELLKPVQDGLAVEGAAQQLALLRGVAEGLMNRWELWIGGRRHRIVEMEAYVHGPAHADPYVHGDDGQQHGGCWYFHRMGGSFKGGSFKGLDLASGGGRGSDGSEVRAGLLLRSVMEISEPGAGSGELTEGPCLVVDRILRLCGQASIAAFVDGRGAAELPAASTEGLQLRPAPRPCTERVWAAPRVGLVLRDDEKGKTHSRGRPADFVARPYRFSVVPQRLSKFRGGFAAAAYVAGSSGGEAGLRRDLGMPKAAEYVAAVEAGLARGGPEHFVDRKIATQQDLCELYGACFAAMRSRGDAPAATSCS